MPHLKLTHTHDDHNDQPQTREPTSPGVGEGASGIDFASAEARRHPRLKLPAMYTLLRARPEGDDRYRWTGYIYDVSEGGLRIELDEQLEPGTPIEVRGVLPGSRGTSFRASGKVVRLHDTEDDFGPFRMGVALHAFKHEADHERLNGYLRGVGKIAA